MSAATNVSSRLPIQTLDQVDVSPIKAKIDSFYSKYTNWQTAAAVLSAIALGVILVMAEPSTCYTCGGLSCLIVMGAIAGPIVVTLLAMAISDIIYRKIALPRRLNCQAKQLATATVIDPKQIQRYLVTWAKLEIVTRSSNILSCATQPRDQTEVTTAVGKIVKCLNKEENALNLSYLQLRTLPTNVLRFSWIKEVNLSNNKIADLSVSYPCLPNLKSLDLSGNPLKRISVAADAFRDLERIVVTNEVQVEEALRNKIVHVTEDENVRAAENGMDVALA